MAKKQGITLLIDGRTYDQWVSADVERDMRDFSGNFSFTFRDSGRSANALQYSTAGTAYALRPGPAVDIKVDGQTVLRGWIEKVSPDIEDGSASVTISGRDKTGDLVDSAALVEGAAEFKNVKLEDAARRIAAPFGLGVRSDIDTGEPFARYSLDLGETAFSAIEKGARSRHALMMSDGIGNIVVTRTGASRAPSGLTLPGNVLGSSGTFSHEKRHSPTIVRGQAEKVGKERADTVAVPIGGTPKAVSDRQAGDGSATEKERKGTAATGKVEDPEITRYRPVVHLARSKADAANAQDEADWRSRTARGEGEEVTYRVKGHGVNGRLWKTNEMTYVSDAFQDIERDMLISNVKFREDESGRTTELKVTSPEAFDKGAVGKRRTNAKKKSGGGALDGTANGL